MTKEQHVKTLMLRRAMLADEIAMLKARRERAAGLQCVHYRAQLEALMRRDRQLSSRLGELSHEPDGVGAALRSTWRDSVDRLRDAVVHWIDHVDAANP